MRPRWLWNTLLFLAVSFQLSDCEGTLGSIAWAAQPGFAGLPRMVVTILILLLVFVMAAVVLAAILVQLGVKTSIVAFFVSSIVLSFTLTPFYRLFFMNEIWLDVDEKRAGNILLPLVLTAFFVSFGSSMAVGFFYKSQIVLLLLIITGFAGVWLLALNAYVQDERRPKIGLYIAAFVLSYELWLLMRAMLALD